MASNAASSVQFRANGTEMARGRAKLRAETRGLDVKNRQNRGQMRRSHLQPCPMRNDRHRERELVRSAHLLGSAPARPVRTRGRTYPRSPAVAALSRASTLAISGRRLHWFDSHRTSRFESRLGWAGRSEKRRALTGAL